MYQTMFKDIDFIFLTGNTRAGKDTFAMKIAKYFKTVKKKQIQIIRLADCLKLMYRCQYDQDNTLTENDFKNFDMRQKLFTFSKEIKKIQGDSFFCRQVFQNVNLRSNIIIVPDLRFKEEYIYFKNNLTKMKIIKIIDESDDNTDYLNVYDINEIQSDLTIKKFENFKDFDKLIF